MSECLTDKITIDELTVHLGEWQVYRDGNKVEMTKQSLDLLLALANAWPNTLSQQALMNEVWAGRVVSEQSVKQAIKRLRESLEDLGDSYIKVVRGRGYRLDCAKVEAIEKLEVTEKVESIEQASQQQKVAKTLSFKAPWLLGVAGLVLLTSIYFAVSHLSSTEPQRVATQPASVENQTETSSEQAYQYYLSGLEYYKRYRVEDAKIAIRQFNKAIELDDQFVKAYAALSDAQSLVGNLEEAIITAEHAISLARSESSAYKALGHAYSLKGWFNKAIETYRRSLKIDPNNFAAITNTGFHFRELGRLDEALSWSLRALELDSKNAIIYLHIAETLGNLGMQELALKWFEKVKSVRPDYYYLYYSMTYFYLASGNVNEAVNIITQGRELLPDNVDISVAAADVAMVEGKYEQALSLFLQVSRSPEHQKLVHYARLRVGHIYWLQGETQKAAELLDQALEQAQLLLAQGDEWPGNYVDIASVFAVKQAHVEALAWLDRAFDAGWVNYQWLKYDPAFKSMQGLAEFNQLLTKVERKVLLMREKSQQFDL